jgi:hypothetical protein
MMPPITFSSNYPSRRRTPRKGLRSRIRKIVGR